jgi:hypothetical protein
VLENSRFCRRPDPDHQQTPSTAPSAPFPNKTLPDEVMEETASNDIAAVATLLGNSSVLIKEKRLSALRQIAHGEITAEP